MLNATILCYFTFSFLHYSCCTPFNSQTVDCVQLSELFRDDHFSIVHSPLAVSSLACVKRLKIGSLHISLQGHPNGCRIHHTEDLPLAYGIAQVSQCSVRFPHHLPYHHSWYFLRACEHHRNLTTLYTKIGLTLLILCFSPWILHGEMTPEEENEQLAKMCNKQPMYFPPAKKKNTVKVPNLSINHLDPPDKCSPQTNTKKNKKKSISFSHLFSRLLQQQQKMHITKSRKKKR